MWIMILLMIVILIILYIITQPLIPLLILKWKYGEKAKLYYYPIWGLFYYLNKHQIQNNDPYYEFNKLFQKEPQLEMILTNLQLNPLIVLLKPQNYKSFLVNHQNYDKFQMIPDLRLASKGMILEGGEKWKQQKMLLGAHFKYEQLISRIPLMNEVMTQKILNKQIVGDTFPSIQLTSQIAGDFLLRAFFGKDIAQLDLNGEEQANCVTIIISNIGQLLKSMFFYVKWVFLKQYVWKYFKTQRETEIYNLNTNILNHMRGIIQNRLDDLTTKKREMGNDFLDIYLDAYITQTEQTTPKITMDEIIQQCITLFFAGTETTANLVTTSLYFLAKNQDLQQQLYGEIGQIVGDSKLITQEHLAKLKQVTGFLMEILRIRPVVQSLVSRQSKVDQFCGDIFIKKGILIELQLGWFVNYMSTANGLNSQYFANPEKIDVNRWTADGKSTSSTLDPFAFIPFAAGGRNCIGQHMALMEAKMMLCYFLRKYQFYLNEKYDQPKWETRITNGLQHFDFVKFKIRE